MPRALIVYATGEGQTRKIANALAETLRGEDFTVDVVEDPDDDVRPGDYDAVLVGGSIHIGKVQRSIIDWARRHHEALEARHDAFFGVCMAAASDAPAKREEVQGYVDTFLELAHWHPDRAIMFAGALRFTQYGLIKRWLMAAIARSSHTPFEDTRHDYEFTDWSSVEAFGKAFARELALPRPSTASSGATV